MILLKLLIYPIVVDKMNVRTPNLAFRKALLPIAAAAIAALGAAYGYQKLTNNTPPDISKSSQEGKIDTNPPTDEQIEAGRRQKEATIKNNGAAQPGSSERPMETNGQLSVTITSANQTTSTLSIRSLISGVSNSGTCTLRLTKDASVLTETAGTQALASSSTCKGFDIPLSKLSAGKWQISLSVTSESLSGQATLDITIK